MNKFSCFLAYLLILCWKNIPSDGQKCSWEACHAWKPGMLNVHLVPHTHDDAGWLKTVDQYFWGSNQSIDNGGIQYILDTVIAQLQRDPRRRFSYCETGFFWQWWMMQHDYLRHQVKKLVNDGQLEFINGGWVQNDEATTHYTAIIDQMTYGLRKLNETFGKCAHPKVAWQIDPFGHSREQAATFAQMGMDALFFSRLHYIDHDKRKNEKRMEFLWKGSDDLGAKADLFTGVLFEGYGAPPGFCFDDRCTDDPIMDDDRFEGYNLPEKLTAFLNWTSKQNRAYETNHIMLTMGGDFTYRNADMWFNNLEKIILYINEMQGKGGKVNVFYSTPSCYVKALHEAKLKWTSKADDFFPYASGSHSYWTGFFTSRPALKGFVRQSNGLLQMCKQLDATARLGPADFGDIDMGKKAMGFLQHHDGVSGTEKQHVAKDYAKRLYKGNIECQQVINDAFLKLLPKSSGSVPWQTLCFRINETICNVSQLASQFVVTAFNPQGHTVSTYVRIPVTNSFTVLNSNGTAVQAQNVELTFDDTTGLLSQMKDVISGQTVHMRQNFYWYKSAIYGNKTGRQPSGAYIFRPNGTLPRPVTTGNLKIQKITGPLFDEIRQTFNSWVSQTVRLYKDKPYAELEWTVGPIPYADKIGREIISRFDTDISSGTEFFTDSNGRQILTRRRNFQPTYSYNNTEPVTGNYYPINSKIYIKDANVQITILADRSQGGSSIKNGSLELMLHRRLFQDDNFGVGECLNETGVDGRGLVVRGKQWLILSSVSKAPALHRQLALDMFYEPILAFATTDLSFVDYRKKYRTQFSGLRRPLPPNVHLLTLEQWQASTLLIRLEHIYQNQEDAQLSKPVTVSLTDLFSTFDVLSIEEMNLSANEQINKVNRLRWRQMTPDSSPRKNSRPHRRSRLLNRWGDRRRILRRSKKSQGIIHELYNAN